MELYDNQGSSTPLTAKNNKSQPQRGKAKKGRPLEFTQKRSFLFAYKAKGRGFYCFLGSPTRGTPRTVRQSPSYIYDL